MAGLTLTQLEVNLDLITEESDSSVDIVTFAIATDGINRYLYSMHDCTWWYDRDRSDDYVYPSLGKKLDNLMAKGVSQVLTRMMN